jgi:pimeloyl-ACP methyl ester carboxylesterase
MAVLHPELVQSVVEWGAAGTLGTGELLPEFDAIYDLLDNPGPDLREWGEYVRESYGEDVGRRMVRGWVEASRAIIANGGDISLSRAHEIRCPALLLSGEHDPYATPAMTRALAARITNATYEIVPGAGHALHHEQPEWFVGRVTGWLEEETRNEKRD